MPSMQAPASPRRPMRRMQRTRLSVSPSSRATAAVPSGELSSTNNTSQSTPSSVRASFSTSNGTLSRSLNVGTTTLNSGAGRADAAELGTRAGEGTFIAGGDRRGRAAFQCGWTLPEAHAIDPEPVRLASTPAHVRAGTQDDDRAMSLVYRFNDTLARLIDALADPARRR